MSNNAKTSVNRYQEMEGLVFPACDHCGHAYRPKRPIDPLTVFFKSDDWLANFYFKIERFFQQLRKARMRKL